MKLLKQNLVLFLVVSLVLAIVLGDKGPTVFTFAAGGAPSRAANSRTITATGSADCTLPGRLDCADSCGLNISH